MRLLVIIQSFFKQFLQRRGFKDRDKRGLWVQLFFKVTNSNGFVAILNPISVTLGSVTQHTMSQKFSVKLRMEFFNSIFSLPAIKWMILKKCVKLTGSKIITLVSIMKKNNCRYWSAFGKEIYALLHRLKVCLLVND